MDAIFGSEPGASSLAEVASISLPPLLSEAISDRLARARDEPLGVVDEVELDELVEVVTDHGGVGAGCADDDEPEEPALVSGIPALALNQEVRSEASIVPMLRRKSAPGAASPRRLAGLLTAKASQAADFAVARSSPATQLPCSPKRMRNGTWMVAIGPSSTCWASNSRRSDLPSSVCCWTCTT